MLFRSCSTPKKKSLFLGRKSFIDTVSNDKHYVAHRSSALACPSIKSERVGPESNCWRGGELAEELKYLKRKEAAVIGIAIRVRAIDER